MRLSRMPAPTSAAKRAVTGRAGGGGGTTASVTSRLRWLGAPERPRRELDAPARRRARWPRVASRSKVPVPREQESESDSGHALVADLTGTGPHVLPPRARPAPPRAASPPP